MKIIVKYECTICGNRYDTAEDALACEARGYAKEMPIGLIYGDNRPGAFYENIVFAVARNNTRLGGVYNHYNRIGSWACRNNGVGDSLGDEVCGPTGVGKGFSSHDGHVDTNSPMYKRMVEYLKSVGIKPLLWNGAEIVEAPDEN